MKSRITVVVLASLYILALKFDAEDLGWYLMLLVFCITTSLAILWLKKNS